MLEIFQYDFMIRAFIAGLMIAVVAPFMGTFLVVRGYSHMADTLAHVSLLGVAIGLFLSVNPVVAALITSLFAGFGIEKLRATKRLGSDAILALMLSGSLALAVVIISFSNGLNADLFSYLFGSITTVTQQDLVLIVSLSFVILGGGLLFYKEFFFVGFDEELAQADGVSTSWFNVMLVVLAAMTVSIAMRIVGILLVSALMVIPVLTAFQFKLSFKKTLMVSIGVALVSVFLGLFSSYYLDIASGGAIVLIALFFFFVALFWNRVA